MFLFSLKLEIALLKYLTQKRRNSYNDNLFGKALLSLPEWGKLNTALISHVWPDFSSMQGIIAFSIGSQETNILPRTINNTQYNTTFA